VKVAFVVALVAISLSGCGSTPGPSPAASTRTATPLATAGSTASASAVVIDRSLLGLLPGNVNGFGITESPEGEASAAQSRDLSTVATGFAAGLAADPAGGDWAFAVVVALRPGVMSDATFRGWRDSYDAGACSQAGGVGGHAQAEIAGRTTYITTCGGGLHTYHVWLPAQQRLVSISAVGDRRFGELLVKGLRT
jgi:hypothetical protein